MADQEAPKPAGKPTTKMLEFAKAIAAKINVRVPDEVMTSYDECSKFIEANKDAAMRPSDKQLKYAETIASNKGIEIPDDVKGNGKELSRWIDANK